MAFWTEKVTILTGASSGIGAATALELGRAGARLVLAARREAAIQQLAGQIQAQGGQALTAPTDVTQPDQVQRMVQLALERWGRIDVLISNAGQYVRAPAKDVPIEDLQASMAVNFYAGVYAIQAVLPHMLEQHSGHIVILSTMDAKKGVPPDAPYVAAKSALSGYAEVLRQELHGSGVGVTTLFPGRVDTPLIADLSVPWISAKIPPEAVARAILRGVERRKVEMILPPQAGMLHLLNFISPSLADWAVRSFGLSGKPVKDQQHR